jgi:plastocyanin
MRTIRFLLVPALVLTLGAGACGGGGDGGDGSDECVDLTTEGDSFTIRMSNNQFVPSCFTARASQTLTLVNEDAALHSFTMRDTPIDVDVRGDETLNLDPVGGIVEPGTYELICRYHLPGMTGQVTVVE